MTSHCYLPLSNHSEEPSDEHIFPESIGGQLKARGLLCQKHNSEFGHTIDSALVQAFAPYCVLLGMDRESDTNGKSFQLEIDGRKVNLFANGRGRLAHPKFERTVDAATGKEQIRIEAPDEDYLRLLLEQFKKTRPNLPLQNPQSETYPVTLNVESNFPRIEIPFFNKLVRRSACKTIANLWILRTGRLDPIDSLVKFVLDESTLPISPYYESEIVTGKPARGILNSVVIAGSSDERKLVGYVEILDAYRLIVLIRTDYDGPDIAFHLCENVTADDPVDKVTLNLAPLFAYSDYDIKSTQLDTDKIDHTFSRLKFAVDRNAKFNRIFNAAMDTAMEDYEKTQDLARFIAIISEKLAFGLAEHFGRNGA